MGNLISCIKRPTIGPIPTTSIDDLPPEILVQIFQRIPAEYRLVVAAVCQPWRDIFLGTPACWSGIRLGRNSNWYSSTPPPIHRADYYPLTHVEEIQFTPAIPAVMRGVKVNPDADDFLDRLVTVDHQLKKIPNEWLGVVLQHAVKLKSLDLSAMFVNRRTILAFR